MIDTISSWNNADEALGTLRPENYFCLKEELVWCLSYYASEAIQAYRRYRVVLLYFLTDRLRMLDPADDEFAYWSKEEIDVHAFRTNCYYHIQYLFYAVPIVLGTVTLSLLMLTNKSFDPIDSRHSEHPMLRPIFTLAGIPKTAKELYDQKINQLIDKQEARERRRLKRLQRAEYWLSEPIVNEDRLRYLTIKPNKTPREIDELNAEWHRYYLKRDARTRISGRFIIRKEQTQKLTKRLKKERKAHM